MIRQQVKVEPNGKIRCDACPVLCYIKDGRAGACDRYANENGELVRVDAFTVIEQRNNEAGEVVAFLPGDEIPSWDGTVINDSTTFVTAIGASTTYPDYKPAPFIVGQQHDGVDMVTVVTEGIFSYCGAKVKIDTDRHVGPEHSLVRVQGEPVGHVTTGEYGSQMLSLGGVNHLTGGSKKEGRITCEALLNLCNREPVEMSIDGGVDLVVQAGRAPIVNGVEETLMRVGCGSATIGMFAKQWEPHVDEVVVVDDHITGVLSEHQAGKLLGMQPTGIKIKGRKSTPGRYFQVAEPGMGWGGTNIDNPLSILDDFKQNEAKPGLRLLMVSTTGEQYAFFTLDENLVPIEAPMPEALKPSVERVAENCEPSLCSVLFMGGAGGSLRAGVTENPVGLTRSVRHSLTHVSCGGAPAYIWPGGGITLMVDVMQLPNNAFGYVPTPALVAPIEFTLRRCDFEAMGGHMDSITPIETLADQIDRCVEVDARNSWPMDRRQYHW